MIETQLGDCLSTKSGDLNVNDVYLCVFHLFILFGLVPIFAGDLLITLVLLCKMIFPASLLSVGKRYPVNCALVGNLFSYFANFADWCWQTHFQINPFPAT